MTRKVGRNDPCQCGSGLKHKKCCLQIGTKFGDRSNNSTSDFLEEYFAKFNSLDLALTIAALSINPKNHGKNLRLDYLALLALSKKNFTDEFVNKGELQAVLTKKLPKFQLEDPPENLFTENIISPVGNSVIYGGNYEQGSFTLQHQINALNFYKTDYSEEFHNKCDSVINLCLILSNTICSSQNHDRNLIGEYANSADAIEFQEELASTKRELFFSWNFLDKLCQIYSLNRSHLGDLIIDIADIDLAKVEMSNIDYNPIILKPFLSTNGGLWAISPTNIIVSLQIFIWKSVVDYECENLFANNFHNSVLRELYFQILRLDWVKLVYNFKNIDERCTVDLFRFDDDKIAIVGIVKDTISNFKANAYNQNDPSSGDQEINHLFEEALTNIRKDYPKDKILFIELYSSIGRSYYNFGSNDKSIVYINTSVFRFIQAIRSGKRDRLFLWYYCLSRNRFEKDVRVSPIADFGEKITVYLKDHTFYLNDQAKPNYIVFQTGNIVNLIQQGNESEDPISVGYMLNEDSPIVFLSVIKEVEKIKRYASKDFRSNKLEYYIPGYTRDFWVKYSAEVEPTDKARIPIWEFTEAFCYWFYELRIRLNVLLGQGIAPFYFTFDFESDYHLEDGRYSKTNMLGLKIKCSITNNGIHMRIPREARNYLIKKDNEGERIIILALLKGFKDFLVSKRLIGSAQFNISEQIELLDLLFPLGRKKMIISINTNDNIGCDPRNLGDSRYIQIAAEQLIMDELVPLLGDKCPPIGDIIGKRNKKEFCKNIVRFVLLPKIKSLLNNIDSLKLLRKLLITYESILNQNALFKYRLPYRLECFSEYEDVYEKISEQSHNSDKTTIALRCLIEHCVAEPRNGDGVISTELIDNLIATMSMIVFWGGVGDMIEYELFDVELEILPSGRIGTNTRQIVSSYFDEFVLKRSEELISDVLDSLEKTGFSGYISKELHKSLDDAFKQSYGITLTKLQEFFLCLMEISFNGSENIGMLSMISLSAEVNKISELNFSIDEILTIINSFSLKSRGLVESVPKGYSGNDISPWRYNRKLSYLQKPLILIDGNDGDNSYILFTPRHLDISIKYIKQLIYTGRFKAKEGSRLNQVIGKLANFKGANFQNKVLEVLKSFEHSILLTEISIAPKGNLKSDEDIGDIDILFINDEYKLVLLIECKNTEPSRNTKEMIEEVGSYCKFQLKSVPRFG